MVKVRALQTLSTTASRHEAGDVFQASEREAVAWANAGLVAVVPVVAEEERAVAPAPEVTSAPRKGKR